MESNGREREKERLQRKTEGRQMYGDKRRTNDSTHLHFSAFKKWYHFFHEWLTLRHLLPRKKDWDVLFTRNKKDEERMIKSSDEMRVDKGRAEKEGIQGERQSWERRRGQTKQGLFCTWKNLAPLLLILASLPLLLRSSVRRITNERKKEINKSSISTLLMLFNNKKRRQRIKFLDLLYPYSLYSWILLLCWVSLLSSCCIVSVDHDDDDDPLVSSHPFLFTVFYRDMLCVAWTYHSILCGSGLWTQGSICSCVWTKMILLIWSLLLNQSSMITRDSRDDLSLLETSCSPFILPVFIPLLLWLWSLTLIPCLSSSLQVSSFSWVLSFLLLSPLHPSLQLQTIILLGLFFF